MDLLFREELAHAKTGVMNGDGAVVMGPNPSLARRLVHGHLVDRSRLGLDQEHVSPGCRRRGGVKEGERAPAERDALAPIDVDIRAGLHVLAGNEIVDEAVEQRVQECHLYEPSGRVLHEEVIGDTRDAREGELASADHMRGTGVGQQGKLLLCRLCEGLAEERAMDCG